MLEYLLIGTGYAFAAAWQPGPFQAFLLSRVAAAGWRRTLPAALAPLISDGPIAVLILAVLRSVPDSFETSLRAFGGLVLLFFAWRAWRQWRQEGSEREASPVSAPRTVWQATLVNAVNPGPWLGWSLIMGPMTIEAWRLSAGHAVALVGGFYVTMTANLLALIVLMGTTGRLRPERRRVLHLLTVAALAALGLWRLFTALL